MSPDTYRYLKMLTEEIHSVVVAATDDNGLPTTRVIDLMLHDYEGLYFLTAKGKAFHEQLMEKPYVSLSGMVGETETMSKKAITVHGEVKNIGTRKMDEIFKINPYMAEIFPTSESRQALDVFWLYKGEGEFFDLSTEPATRGSFALGGNQVQDIAYNIADTCDNCGLCRKRCPQQCIFEGRFSHIDQDRCIHCGICFDICPRNAVVRAS